MRFLGSSGDWLGMSKSVWLINAGAAWVGVALALLVINIFKSQRLTLTQIAGTALVWAVIKAVVDLL